MAVVEVQILNYVLASKSFDIIENNLITDDYFVAYKDEFKFIKDHVSKYGNVPDTATFISNFNDFDILEVTESEKYLVDTIREEHLYYQSVPILQRVAELSKTDSNAALEYWQSQMSELQPTYAFGGTDIIHNADDRLNQFIERRDKQDSWFFTTGFEELDDIIHGIQRDEELLVIFARTGAGKTWVLEKIMAHIWQIGFNVGFFEPEMSANSIGFRFDTLINGVSNSGLMWGKKDLDSESYQSHLDTIKQRDNVFMVATPKELGGKVTVSKLKSWIVKYKLDAIAIDGITYLDDERYRKGDSVTTSLTHISEDLMSLSVEMKVPVLVVVQANRSGVAKDDKDGAPELESIRDSDGISHNASKVLSLLQKKDHTLEICVKKQRFGAVGGKIHYNWDIDKGIFTPISINTDENADEEPKRERKKKVIDEGDVF